MRIAVTIVHNKSAQQNESQISLILSLLDIATTMVSSPKMTQTIEETPDNYGGVGRRMIQTPVLDAEGKQIYEDIPVYSYQIKALNIPHEVVFYQVVPYGVASPSNINDLDSYKVWYGKGDEDKTADHPRFFNWGLKRGIDHGADISIYLNDPSSVTMDKIKTTLQNMGTNDFTEQAWGKLATKRLLKKIGQLKEDRNLPQAITDYKTRIQRGGLTSG